MKETLKNNWKENYFSSEEFQIKWKRYLKSFGSEMNEIFGSDYDKKTRLTNGLELLLNNKLNDAYHELKHFVPYCNEEDKRILDKLIKLCFNEEQMSQVQEGDWVKCSSHGYYQVIIRNSKYTVIKQAFDFKLNYVKQSKIVDHYKYLFTDLKTYQFVDKKELNSIHDYFSSNTNERDLFLRYSNKMISFRKKMFEAHFQEAKYDFRQFNFYRKTSDKVAFIVNLKDYGEFINVVYGFTTIPDIHFFENYGEDDEDIKVRSKITIKDEEDEIKAVNSIYEFFDLYRLKAKEEILALKKEKQKKFLQKIHTKLKPLGFKKKNSRWLKTLEEDYFLGFEAEKSQWSDEYYFDICVYKSRIQYPPCYSFRLITNKKGKYNWQLLSDIEIDELLDTVIEKILLPIINTPLNELGEKKDIWLGCTCNREKCTNCWVKKNMWEVK